MQQCYTETRIQDLCQDFPVFPKIENTSNAVICDVRAKGSGKLPANSSAYHRDSHDSRLPRVTPLPGAVVRRGAPTGGTRREQRCSARRCVAATASPPTRWFAGGTRYGVDEPAQVAQTAPWPGAVVRRRAPVAIREGSGTAA